MAFSVHDLLKKRNDPEHLNWIAVSDAINILSDGLRQYVDREMKKLHHSLVTSSNLGGVKCACLTTPGVKPSSHDNKCDWGNELRKLHSAKKRNHIPWYQSDSSKWHDIGLGYWEIAKIFMSDLGSNWNGVKDPSSTDPTGLLNLLIFCRHFKIDRSLLKEIRDWRNKWAHVPNQVFNELDKQTAFIAIMNLINDVELMSCKEVQDCRAAIEEVRVSNAAILEEKHLRIIEEYRRLEECELKNRRYKMKEKEMNESIAASKKEKSARIEHPSETTYLHVIVNVLPSIFATILILVFQPFVNKSSRCLRCFLAIAFLVSQVGDKSTFLADNDCFRCIKKSPISHLHFQEFNFSSYLAYKREHFFGRKWLFKELEDLFESGRGPVGVLITGEPGSGKTALMSQLICSPFSSLLIHNNIIGYHLCDYSETGKRNGARFVRNLVDQIAGSISEYSDYVANNEFLRGVLNNRCESDPTGCFSTAIVDPLRVLRKQPDGNRYIVLDALDECFEKDGKTSAILHILSSKLLDFPKWLKVILSTRNWTAVTTKVPPTLKRMPLDPTDEHNVEDIRSYITRFISQSRYFMDRLLEAMSLKSTTDGINSLLNELTKSGEGNFLFVKTTLHYMNESDGRINLRSFPTRLYDTYDIFFKRHFSEQDFWRFKTLFEILLAAGSPLHINEINVILKLQNQTQEASKLVEQISFFLHFAHDGTVNIYHQSFAEWLANQADCTGGFSIHKSNGHRYIVDFLLHRYRRRNASLTFEELSELSMHVVSGGLTENHKQLLQPLNVSEIRDPHNNRCILHDLATKADSSSILEFFLRMFVSADITDAEGKTPAFYAASEGIVENLKLFIDKGIDINPILRSFPSLDPISTVVQNKGIEDFSMIHVAAYKGHAKIVELLIESNVSYIQPIQNEPTPFHLAAGNGQLDVVKLLYSKGAKADLISLHHAAARNHSAVVKFLLKTAGVRDKCVTCKPSNFSDFNRNATLQKFHSFFCESALHAAVSRGNIYVVKLLLSFGHSSVECKHHSGKTPLMDAVERNDAEMVELLLDENANAEEKCGNEISRSWNKQMCDILSMYKDGFLYTVYCEKDVCACGNTAMHLCARYGLWEMAEKLIMYKRNVNKLDKNCNEESMREIAINFDHADFIQHFIRAFPRIFNPVHLVFLAARCGSIKTLKLFANNPDLFAQEIGNGRSTPLTTSVLWSPYPHRPGYFSCSVLLEGDFHSLSKKINIESQKRVATVKLLAELSQKNISLFLNKKDKDGNTALHFAARFGFNDAVKYLVQHGSNVNAKDPKGETPLQLALVGSPMSPSFSARCYTTTDGVFTTCNTTSYDDTVAYLIWSQRSSIKICDSESASLLRMTITKQMPLSLYSLIKIGVDKNCRVKQPERPFLFHLNIGGKQVSEIFKIFEIDVSVQCGVPFRDSELHILAYSSVADDVGNFFKPSVNNRTFPLKRLIDKHPKGFQIFDECRDAEGYLAIHRAAQGGNLDAIEWFISIGVDVTQKTISGLTAVDLSVLYLGDVPHSKDIFSIGYPPIPLTSSKYRRHTFDLFLAFFATEKYEQSTFNCDTKFKRLSPLHIAAVRGITMLELVFKEANKFITPSLRLDCANKHNIVPLYLAHFYQSIENMKNKLDSSQQNVDGGDDSSFLQYPDREAEYHIIYNYFYHSPQEVSNTVFFKMLPTLDNYDIADCFGFYDLLPKKETRDEMVGDKHSDSSTHESDEEPTTSLQPTEHLQNADVETSTQALDFYQPNEQDCNIGICIQLQRLLIEKHAQEYYCPIIMRYLQSWFTKLPRRNRRVSQFIAQRMGWEDISADGDVKDRWPFYFFYKKLTNRYKSYDYLEALNDGLEIYHDDQEEEEEEEEGEKG